MAERAAELGKSLVFFSRVSYAVSQYGAQFQETCKAPFLQEMRRSFQAIGHLVAYYRFQQSGIERIRNDGLPQYDRKRASSPTLQCLPENAAFALLREAGIPVARFEMCDSLETAQRAAERIGYPVALKISVPGLTHKTEVAGVWLGLGSREDLARAFNAAQERASSLEASGCVLVQEMVRGEIELYIGSRRDPEFGPIVTMGFGGIFVEAIGKSSSRLAPVNASEAKEMLIESGVERAVERLTGDFESVCGSITDSVMRFSHLIAEHEAIDTLEVNPLIVKRTGSCTAVDIVVVTQV
jgi:acetyltransferase